MVFQCSNFIISLKFPHPPKVQISSHLSKCIWRIKLASVMHVNECLEDTCKIYTFPFIPNENRSYFEICFFLSHWFCFTQKVWLRHRELYLMLNAVHITPSRSDAALYPAVTCRMKVLVWKCKHFLTSLVQDECQEATTGLHR